MGLGFGLRVYPKTLLQTLLQARPLGFHHSPRTCAPPQALPSNYPATHATRGSPPATPLLFPSPLLCLHSPTAPSPPSPAPHPPVSPPFPLLCSSMSPAAERSEHTQAGKGQLSEFTCAWLGPATAAGQTWFDCASAAGQTLVDPGNAAGQTWLDRRTVLSGQTMVDQQAAGGQTWVDQESCRGSAKCQRFGGRSKGCLWPNGGASLAERSVFSPALAKFSFVPSICQTVCT